MSFWKIFVFFFLVASNFNSGLAQYTTTSQSCGNEKVENYEECDDGNIIDSDGCSSKCALEGRPPLAYSSTAETCSCISNSGTPHSCTYSSPPDTDASCMEKCLREANRS